MSFVEEGEQALQLVRTFVELYLEGDLIRFKDFDLSLLKGDKALGCPGRSFDCDDTNLARAIYSIVFKDAFNGLSLNTLGSGLYRGDTMNSFRTLLGQFEGNYVSCEDLYCIPSELLQKIHKFTHTYHTIGNMVPLPNGKTSRNLNMMRASIWHDYFDRFWMAVCDYFCSTSYHEKFTPLMEANNFAFVQYERSQDGFRDLTHRLFLEDYADGLLFQGLTLKRKAPADDYIAEALHYVDSCTDIIYKRSERIIQSLRKVL